MMGNALEEIQASIDEGRLNYSQKLISEIVNTEGFDRINQEHIIKIFYFQGLVYLDKEMIDESKQEADKIFKIYINSYYGFNLSYKIAVHTDNQALYQQSIDGFVKLSIDQTELKLKEIFYELTKGNFTGVISELTELDEVKEQFETNEDALYYLGLSYLQTQDFSLAKKHFVKSNELKPSSYKTYLITLSNVIPIINRRGALYLITQSQKEMLIQSLRTLLDIKEYFSEKHILSQEEFWGYVLNVKLFIKPSEIISDVEEMGEKLKQSDMIQLMLAEAYSIVGPADKSEEIYKVLYQKRKNPELLDKITTRLTQKKDYTGILQLLSEIDYSEYDELGEIAGTHIMAFSKLNTFPASIELIKEMEKIFTKAPLFYQAAAIVFWENDKPDLSKEFMEKAISIIEEDNEALRMFISGSCEEIGLIDLAINVLLPLKYSTKAKETILRLSLDFNYGNDDHNQDDDDENNEMLELAEKIVNQLIEEGQDNLNIYNAKAEIAIRKEKPEEALKHLIESFRLSPSINTAYNIVAIMVNTNQALGLQEFIDYLINSLNPRATMLAASALDYLGSRNTAVETAYKSLELLGDEFDETIYLQYSMLFMVSKNIPNDDQVKIEYDNIRTDTVIELIDNSGEKRFICIESNPNLVKKEGVVFLNVEHYTNSSTKSIKLLTVELNKKVDLDGIEYYVNHITDKYVHAFRYVSSTYIQKVPNSPFLHAIEIRDNDPLTPFIPMLDEDRRRQEFLMDQYNFANGIGLPVSTLCNNNYFSYPSAIGQLLETKEQVFYAGGISHFEKTDLLVLSFSSIVLLSFLRCTDIIKNNKDNFKITKTLIDKVKSLFDEAVTRNSRVSGTMKMDKSGRPIYNNFSTIEKENTIEFWRNIYLVISELETIDVAEGYTLDVNATKLVGKVDIDTIVASNQINAIFISDDLFLHKFAYYMYDSLSVSNSVTILNQFLSTEELLDKLLTLAKFKYHNCINSGMVLGIINNCLLGKTIIYDPGTSIDKIIQIVRNILSHPQLFKDNLPMLIEVTYKLYENRLNHKVDEIINLIIREIVISSRQYKISTSLLQKIFEGPAGIDLIKAEYFSSIIKNY
ncbi:hypothetical protein ABER68_25970 [Paenibacillus alvei]